MAEHISGRWAGRDPHMTFDMNVRACSVAEVVEALEVTRRWLLSGSIEFSHQNQQDWTAANSPLSWTLSVDMRRPEDERT